MTFQGFSSFSGVDITPIMPRQPSCWWEAGNTDIMIPFLILNDVYKGTHIFGGAS